MTSPAPLPDEQHIPCYDDPDLWFPKSDTPQAYEPAKQLCRTCPAITPCLELALDRGEEYGVWGGLDPRERTRLRRRRGDTPPPEPWWRT